MHPLFTQHILSLTHATGVAQKEVIQNLWSGYGQVIKIHLRGGNRPTVIAKWVNADGPKNQVLNELKTGKVKTAS